MYLSTKMFALLVQYNKLVSVLTGAPTLSPSFWNSMSLSGLGWDLNLKPTPGAWPYGTGTLSPNSATSCFLSSVFNRPLQVKVHLTAKDRAMTSLGLFGTLPVEMWITATVAGAIWLVMCVRSDSLTPHWHSLHETHSLFSTESCCLSAYALITFRSIGSNESSLRPY